MQPESESTGRHRRGGHSRRLVWVLLIAVPAGFALDLAGPRWPITSAAAAGTSEQIAQGAKLYAANCAACHGADAQGQVPGEPQGGQRPDGSYMAPALNGRGHMWHHAPDQLFQIVKFGSPASDSPMKGWQGRMSDAEIEAVIAYLQSLWPDKLRKRYQGMHGRG